MYNLFGHFTQIFELFFVSRHISICADTLKEQQTDLGTDEEALRADAETEYEADLIAIQENSSIKISRENFTVQGKRPQPCCRTAREFDAAMWNFIRKICADIFLDCYRIEASITTALTSDVSAVLCFILQGALPQAHAFRRAHSRPRGRRAGYFRFAEL